MFQVQDDANVSDLVANGPWPPELGEYLAVQSVDGLKICEVVEIISTHEVEANIFSHFQFWTSSLTIEKQSVLPVRPQVESNLFIVKCVSERQTDRQTNRQTDRHTDRQTHRQTHRQADRWNGNLLSKGKIFLNFKQSPIK